jgi:hypothetical protein
MTVRTVNNLPAATHGETARCLFAIRIEQAELDVPLDDLA